MTRRDRAEELAQDVAYVCGLAITANHGTLTTPVASGRTVGDGAVEVRLVVPAHGRLDAHRAEVDTVVAELRRRGATVVDRYAPDPNAATCLRVRVSLASRSTWRELTELAMPSFRHDRVPAAATT